MDTRRIVRRSDYLETLRDGPLTKAALETELGDSRSTVNRAMAELVDAGLVEDVRGECRLTLAGRLAARAVGRFQRQSTGVRSATAVLDGLDPEVDIDLEMVTGATVRPAHGSRPYRAFHAFERLVEDALAIRGSARTFANPRARELFDEAILDRGVPVEFFVDESLFAEIREEFADAFRRWSTTDAFRGFVTPDCPQFTTLVSALPGGPHAGVALYSGGGEFHGVLVNDRRPAVEWAEDLLDDVAADATPIRERL